MNIYVRILAALLLSCLCSVKTFAVNVIPTPRLHKYGKENIQLTEKDKALTFSIHSPKLKGSIPVKRGIRLLTARLKVLGRQEARDGTHAGLLELNIEKPKAEALIELFKKHNVKETIEPARLKQAYFLQIKKGKGLTATITLKANGDLGLYYGLVSLCQLIDKDEEGKLFIPNILIVDWPEIALRLTKVSASSRNTLPNLEKTAKWLPLYKLNQLGLQFHGNNSKKPGIFTKNIKAICSQARRGGILETIVYFCPFKRKGSYNFSRPEDRQKYIEFLLWLLDQGAHGIEIDYNDWPDDTVPIEDVINLACKAIAQKYPDAYVLYCPPLWRPPFREVPVEGQSCYSGPASSEMRRILSEVPKKVWPLWTGMRTFIRKPLRPEQVKAWTKKAGRKPFLWVNDVSVGKQFSSPVTQIPGAYVFKGELLPKELGRLFEGIHFNSVLRNFTPQELAYLATAADYVWNPYDWEPIKSCKKAKRFVEIMLPLLAEETIKPEGK